MPVVDAGVGVDEMHRRAFTKKYSVQFVTPDGRQSQPFYFFQHYDHPSAVTWQIERSEFDQMMLDNARSKGADSPYPGSGFTKFGFEPAPEGAAMMAAITPEAVWAALQEMQRTEPLQNAPKLAPGAAPR